MSFADLVRGARRVLQASINDIDTYWSPLERAHASQMLACSVVTVRQGLETLVDRTKADELIVVSDVFDFEPFNATGGRACCQEDGGHQLQSQSGRRSMTQ